MTVEPLLGAHESAAGGPSRAIERAEAIGCRALQVFVKSPSQWRGSELADSEVAAFRVARAASRVVAVVAHASYLINLAAPGATMRERSIEALADELERARRLGLDALVLHPGAHLGEGAAAGLRRAAAALDAAYARLAADAPPTLLEQTAGQGTLLGARLEELAAIRAAASCEARLGFCLDTCHAFAAGYPVDGEAGWEAFLAQVELTLGLARVRCVHLNDSKGVRGCRRDRHANLGEGEIGLEAFVRVARDPRLAGVPLVLETPLGADGRGHARDLARLGRALARATSRGSASRRRTRSR